MLLQYVFRILQPETGYPFAECHFIRSLDISGKIGTVRIKYFGQFFYGKSLLDIAVCLYPVVNPLYKFCIGPRNFFLRNYFMFSFRICQKFFFRLYILLKRIFYLFIEQQVVQIAVEKIAVEWYLRQNPDKNIFVWQKCQQSASDTEDKCPISEYGKPFDICAYIIRLSFIENLNGSTICNYDSAS